MSFSSCRTIFFDAGNTLLMLDVELIASVFRRLGSAVTLDAIIRADYTIKQRLDAAIEGRDVGVSQVTGGRSYFEELMQVVSVEPDKAASILSELQQLDRWQKLWAKVLPETPGVLRLLQEAGYRLGVISNSDGTVERKLQEVGLARYFETIIDSAVVGVEKPRRKIFELGLERMKADPKTSVYIGDIYGVDVLGAQRVGMQGVLIDPYDLYPVQTQKVRSLTEFATLVHPPRC